MKEPKGRTLRTGVLQSNGRLCCDRREMRQEKPASHKAADQREKRNTTTVQEAGGERKGRVFHPICEIPSPFVHLPPPAQS